MIRGKPSEKVVGKREPYSAVHGGTRTRKTSRSPNPRPVQGRSSATGDLETTRAGRNQRLIKREGTRRNVAETGFVESPGPHQKSKFLWILTAWSASRLMKKNRHRAPETRPAQDHLRSERRNCTQTAKTGHQRLGDAVLKGENGPKIHVDRSKGTKQARRTTVFGVKHPRSWGAPHPPHTRARRDATKNQKTAWPPSSRGQGKKGGKLFRSRQPESN